MGASVLASSLSESASKGPASELMTEKKHLLPWLSQTPLHLHSFPQPSSPHCLSFPTHALSVFHRQVSAEDLGCLCSPKFLRFKHQRLFPMIGRLWERWELGGGAQYSSPLLASW